MKTKIFTFIKPSETATMFSHKIARFISNEIEEPITWNDDIGKQDLDTLFIVGGGVPFCSHLFALARAVLRSKNVVYCTNDYAATRLPSANGHGKSPYRAAFRLRRKRGMKPAKIWSTIAGDDAYVNWNALAWEPDFTWKENNKQNLIYYGSWRKRRIETFDLFFKNPAVKTIIANNSGRFEQRYPQCEHSKLPVENMISLLGTYGVGLYIEDPKSHVEFHSPACRFYEMLGAGLPMAIHRPCKTMLEQANFKIPEHQLVDEAADLKRFMKYRIMIAQEQSNWHSDHRYKVVLQFNKAFKELD